MMPYTSIPKIAMTGKINARLFHKKEHIIIFTPTLTSNSTAQKQENGSHQHENAVHKISIIVNQFLNDKRTKQRNLKKQVSGIR